MASGNKFNLALQIILEDMDETSIAEEDVEAIEAENAKLREKKTELMQKLSRPSTVNNLIVLVKDMLSREQAANQARSEYKKYATMRSKARSRETTEDAASWERRLEEIDFITMPHNEVLQKIEEMDEKIADNQLKTDEMKRECAELSREIQKDDDGVFELNDTLRRLEEEQRKLLEKLNRNGK